MIRAPGSLVRSLVINEFGADGIRIRAADSRVIGCYIGTGAASLANLGNGGAGVRIFGGATNVVIGGTDSAAGNVIVSNGLGILITDDGTDNNRVEGNIIGLRRPAQLHCRTSPACGSRREHPATSSAARPGM